MSRVGSRFLVATLAALLATGWLTARPLPARAAGSVSLTGAAYTEDFNTLASLGLVNPASGLPNGWEMFEQGTSANTNYAAGTGLSTTGDTYSFGGAANIERAFGGLR